MGILRAYVHHTPDKRNIDQKENKALRSLRQRDCVVKCSDKSKSLVIMSTNQYIEKAQAILNDAGKYEVTDMTAEKLEKQASTLLKKIPYLK